jgi:hypothetical protein
MILYFLLLVVMVGTHEVPAGCRQVRMKEEAVCEDEEVEECGVCHTVLARDCDIIMREVWVPLRYKRCTGNRVKPGMCVEGVRTSCNVR